eukprot:scaffold187222_cov36-Prasinocladus_malaysianus.AAC.1
MRGHKVWHPFYLDELSWASSVIVSVRRPILVVHFIIVLAAKRQAGFQGSHIIGHRLQLNT